MWSKVVFLTLFAGITVSAESVVDTKAFRIVSGWPAAEGQFPYMLYIRAVSQHGHVAGCGGSIIHARWGLSSGRCTANRAYLILAAGMVNRHRPRVQFTTTTVFSAPGFNDAIAAIGQPNDLALIGFNRQLTFDAYIQPIRLQRSADARREYNGVVMTTAGWGTTWTPDLSDESVVMSDNLNWVQLRGVTNFMCMLMFNNNFLITESTVCAGPYNVTTQSICSGDSGVPLTTVDVDGRPTQIGVGSLVVGFGCHIGFPAGFVRPGFFQSWMRQVTGINFDW